jgi:hypothetical protein
VSAFVSGLRNDCWKDDWQERRWRHRRFRFRRSDALRNVLSWARWGEANPCFSPTLPPHGEGRTRINARSRLLVSSLHWDAGATNLITKLHVRILTRSLWRVDSIEWVVPDHRFRHCSTSTRSLSVARTTPADDSGLAAGKARGELVAIGAAPRVPILVCKLLGQCFVALTGNGIGSMTQECGWLRKTYHMLTRHALFVIV